MAESLTDDQQHRRRQAVAERMLTTPYMGWLGIVFERYRRKELVFTEITATDSDGTVVAHAVQTYRIA